MRWGERAAVPVAAVEMLQEEGQRRPSPAVSSAAGFAFITRAGFTGKTYLEINFWEDRLIPFNAALGSNAQVLLTCSRLIREIQMRSLPLLQMVGMKNGLEH